jgi:hypothetical protein
MEMDKYKTKYLDFEEKNLGDAINLIETNNLKKPTLKEQKQFKDAAKRFVKKHTTMKIQIDGTGSVKLNHVILPLEF